MIGVGDIVEIVQWPCCGRHIGQRLVVCDVVDEMCAGYECRNESSLLGCKKIHPIPSSTGSKFILDNTIPMSSGLARFVPLAWVRKVPGEDVEERKREPAEITA